MTFKCESLPGTSESLRQSYSIPRLKGRPSAATFIVLLASESIAPAELDKTNNSSLVYFSDSPPDEHEDHHSDRTTNCLGPCCHGLRLWVSCFLFYFEVLSLCHVLSLSHFFYVFSYVPSVNHPLM